MNLILFFLTVYGIAFLIADSHLFAPARRLLGRRPVFNTLLGCYFCLGAKIALVLWFFEACPPLVFEREIVYEAVTFVFSGASVAYILNKVTEALEASVAFIATKFNDNE